MLDVHTVVQDPGTDAATIGTSCCACTGKWGGGALCSGKGDAVFKGEGGGRRRDIPTYRCGEGDTWRPRAPLIFKCSNLALNCTSYYLRSGSGARL
jgi:hypothetical protein